MCLLRRYVYHVCCLNDTLVLSACSALGCSIDQWCYFLGSTQEKVYLVHVDPKKGTACNQVENAEMGVTYLTGNFAVAHCVTFWAIFNKRYT